MKTPWLIAVAVPFLATIARGETTTPPPRPVPPLEETVQVTATRLPEDILDVPAAVTVVQGEELETRGVRDLRGALALVGGVSIAPGGDGGPASSVPELMGLREFDAFLLVVDGVPWGGAFNPALSSLDLTNVDRIEVLRGAAPVLYGATSFVGVIHVIHRVPGVTPRELGAGGGSYGSSGASFTSSLPGGAEFRHALSASAERRGFSDDRAGFDRFHLLWSGEASVAGGTLSTSVDLTGVRQDPASPHPRQGATLSPMVPLDANHNPSDGRIDEDRIHLVARYDRPAGQGAWTTTLALTDTGRNTVRGFLREELDVPPGETNAEGYRQDFDGSDLYLDVHRAYGGGAGPSVVAGIDLLAGKGRTTNETFAYAVPLDGSDPPSSGSLPVEERPEFEDERLFAGAYAEILWSPAPRLRIDAGIRVNATRERQEGEVEENGADVRVQDERSDLRPSGSVGASYRAWQGEHGALWVYGDYRDAFKPAAVDFGPEAEGSILEPETARTLEAGSKGAHRDGRLFWQASVYRMDFENLVLAQTVGGLPSLVNGGSQRFEGLEAEGRWRVGTALTLRASFAAHSARFRDYVTEFDGIPTQLRGNSLEMSPDRLASLGVTWAPARGFLVWVTGNHVGSRYLDKRNTAVAEAFTTVSAGIGYRFPQVEIRLDAENLNDARDPVAESELGEAQYYRFPARRYRVDLVWRL